VLTAKKTDNEIIIAEIYSFFTNHMYLTYLQVSLNFFENRFENHFTDTHLIFSNLKKTDNERIIAEIYSLFYQSFACISYSCMQKHKNIYTVSLWLLIECEGSLVLWFVSVSVAFWRLSWTGPGVTTVV